MLSTSLFPYRNRQEHLQTCVFTLSIIFKHVWTHHWSSPSWPPASSIGKVHHLRGFQIHLPIVTTSYNQHLTMSQWPDNISKSSLLDFLQASRNHTHAWCVVNVYFIFAAQLWRPILAWQIKHARVVLKPITPPPPSIRLGIHTTPILWVVKIVWL